jgi:hypothetical protein
MIKLHYKLTRLIIIMDPIFLVKLLLSDSIVERDGLEHIAELKKS